MDSARKKLLSIAGRLAPRAGRMLREITSYAELPLKETRTSETLASFLAGRGFLVTRGVAGVGTPLPGGFAFGEGGARRGDGIRQGADGREGGLPGNRRGDDGPPVLPPSRDERIPRARQVALHVPRPGGACGGVPGARDQRARRRAPPVQRRVRAPATASRRCPRSRHHHGGGAGPQYHPGAGEGVLLCAGRDSGAVTRRGRAREGVRGRRGDVRLLPS